MQMHQPIAVVDADHRAAAVANQARDPSQVFTVSFDPTEMHDVRTIVDATKADIKASQQTVQTIVVDSLTAIIAPLQTEALMANRAGEHRNKSSAFLDKANAMRMLQDGISQLGTDVLWIWHIEDGAYEGNATERQTLSETERGRLKRNLNAILEIVEEEGSGRRGMKVENLRPVNGGPTQITLWDDSGNWTGMPERIDNFLAGTPVAFRTREEALAAAVRTGVCKTPQEAEKLYNEVKAEVKPANSTIMFAAFAERLAQRKAA